MSRRKNLVVGTGIGLVGLIILFTVLITSFSTPIVINPSAALTATIVAVIGIIWFKKTNS
jgi:hypothetical protein